MTTAIRRATLKDFDSGAYLATVQPGGSLSTWLTDVPVSRAIPSGEMTPGRRVAIAFFEEGNPKDCVLFAVWT